jgi:hypothetical protein
MAEPNDDGVTGISAALEHAGRRSAIAQADISPAGAVRRQGFMGMLTFLNGRQKW